MPSELQRLAELVRQVGDQAGPVREPIAKASLGASRLSGQVPHGVPSAGPAASALQTAGRALAEASRALDQFAKDANRFAARLAGGGGSGSSGDGAGAGATEGPIPGGSIPDQGAIEALIEKNGLSGDVDAAAVAQQYQRAALAKQSIDAVAGEVADLTGGRVVTAPLKGANRALDKIAHQYGGDPSRITDLARNTIVVESGSIEKAIALLKDRGFMVRSVSADADPLGYSGVNSKIRVSSGCWAEVQVNTPDMIFAKEPSADATAQLGSTVYNRLKSKYGATGVQGGLGHKLYEAWRSLPQDDPKRDVLGALSRAYYALFRR